MYCTWKRLEDNLAKWGGESLLARIEKKGKLWENKKYSAWHEYKVLGEEWTDVTLKN